MGHLANSILYAIRLAQFYQKSPQLASGQPLSIKNNPFRVLCSPRGDRFDQRYKSPISCPLPGGLNRLCRGAWLTPGSVQTDP